MKIGVVVSADVKSGGAFRYELALVRSIQRAKRYDVELFVPRNLSQEYAAHFPDLNVIPYSVNKLMLLNLWVRSSFLGFFILRNISWKYIALERAALKNNCSLLYFASPNPLALGVVDLPMVTTVWDLGHRKLPFFPEISGNRHFEEREYYYTFVLPKSIRVVVDSAFTKKDIVNYYAIEPEKIVVAGMPFELSSEEIQAVRQIPVSDIVAQPYIIYPAHFWPHKRHILLLKAFARVTARYPNIKLVLTGANKGNMAHVKQQAYRLGISDRVIFTGFLEYIKVLALVRDAEILVFPSDLGPTNLPPYEASFFGTRCLLSVVHDPDCYISPVFSIVPEQSVECWHELIIRELSRQDETLEGNTELPTSPFTDSLFTELDKIQVVIDEWNADNYERIDSWLAKR